jgi:two-component system cell cycle sensor histidine kinase/response regulator CckA
MPKKKRSKTTPAKPKGAPAKRSRRKQPAESEELFRTIIDAMPVGVLVWRADGLLHYSNLRADEIAGRPHHPGWTPAELIATNRIMQAGTGESYSPDQLPSRLALAGTLVRFEDTELHLPDGRLRPVEGWSAPVRDAAGKVQFAVTAFTDITERRRLDSLRVGEARVLEMVAAGAPLDQTLDTLARVFEAQAEGMRASILLVENCETLRHGAAPNLPAAWIRAVDGQPVGPGQGSCGAAIYLKQPVIAADIATDPNWVNHRAALAFGLKACWAVPILGPDQEALGSFALYYTEPREPTPQLLELATHASRLAAVAILRQRHEQARLESEARARLIVENALDANVLMDGEGTVTGWNVRAAEIFGWTAPEAIGRKLSDLIIPKAFRAQHEAGLRHYLATGEGPILNQRLEILALHRSGREFPVELWVTPIRHDGRVLFSAFIEDITESRQAREALQESKEHLSLVYDHVADVLFQLQVEPDGFRFVSVNPAFARATGLTSSDVIGKLVSEVIPEPSRSLVLAKYAEALRTRKTIQWEETTVFPAGTRHGDVAITPVYDAQGRPKYLIGSVRDITDRKRMEDEVRQLQKLEAVGRLSGGIAHDFNNILGVIVGVGTMLLKDLEDPDKRSQLEEIVRAGERGAKLTQQFLAFSRKQLLQPQVLDLNEVVRGLESMLRRLIRADIVLETSLAPDLWRVKADHGQVEQVVTNLAVNAQDAMPGGGSLSIITENIELNNEFSRTHLGAVPGDYVLLSVSDAGHGMDQETRNRIFDPFFTTKELGKGTGLGLATVYGIVKQSGGYIWVDSSPGQGASFKVYLPRSTAVAGPTRAERGTRRPPGHGLEDVHVMVVEDEPALRSAIERMLRRLKCRVTMVSGGQDALAMVAQEGFSPDLLITDMIMPGMSGSVLTERLRAVRPDLKVLRMSGYAFNEIAQPTELDPAAPFLHKPFTLSELASEIQKALDMF